MWVILLCIGMVFAQNPLKAINDIFTPPTIPAGYEEVTEKAQDDIGALEKCGEGSGRGIRKCVPYYMCDGKTNTIVQTGKTDGFGIIDIRFGANSCQHPLDVCCNEPKTAPDDELPDIPDVPYPSVVTEIPDVPPVPSPSPDPPVTHKTLCGIRNPNGIDFKITGDMQGEAEYGEFPWMVAVLKKNYNPSVDPVLAVCGGSLIAPNVVVTGAHCVYKFKTHEIKVRAGEWDTQTDKERLPYQERDVVDIIIHQDFAPQTLFNDVALLILKDSFNQADNIGTICLPKETIHSKQCFASGWGKTSFSREGEYQVILKKIELPTVTHDQCQDALRATRLGRHFNLHSSFTCAGGEEGKDTCTGDGGSPLVCPDPNNSDRYVQAGIVAWGIGCGEDGVPGVYGDVSKFREWIDENMQRLNLDTSSYYI